MFAGPSRRHTTAALGVPMNATDRYEWAWTMRHPTWQYLELDRWLFGVDFGAIATREARTEAMAEEAVAGDKAGEHGGSGDADQ